MITMYARLRQTDRRTNIMATARRFVLTNAALKRGLHLNMHLWIFWTGVMLVGFVPGRDVTTTGDILDLYIFCLFSGHKHALLLFLASLFTAAANQIVEWAYKTEQSDVVLRWWRHSNESVTMPTWPAAAATAVTARKRWEATTEFDWWNPVRQAVALGFQPRPPSPQFRDGMSLKVCPLVGRFGI